MIQFNISEAKTNLSRIVKMLEEGKEDYVIVTRNGKPLLRIVPEKESDVSKRIGIAKGLFTVPDDFDEIDLSSDFEGEIFP